MAASRGELATLRGLPPARPRFRLARLARVTRSILTVTFLPAFGNTVRAPEGAPKLAQMKKHRMEQTDLATMSRQGSFTVAAGNGQRLRVEQPPLVIDTIRPAIARR